MPRDWQSAAAEQQLPVHVDDRVPGPQGEPEADQGLGRPREARRRGDHAEPEDLRRRALELPGRVGLRARASSAATRRRSRALVSAIYKNAPVLDAGARGSTTTFVERGIGDVLIAWENEALLALETARQGRVRDRRAVAHRSWPSRRSRWSTWSRAATAPARVAEEYLKYLYSPEAQDLIGDAPLPADRPAAAAKYAAKFPKLELLTIDEDFGGWKEAQATFFADGGDLRSDLRAGALRPRWRAHAISVLPGFGLTLGFSILYLSLLVLIPLSALFVRTRRRSRLAEFVAADRLAARARRLPAQLRRVARRGAGERGLRPDRRVGADALPLPGHEA